MNPGSIAREGYLTSVLSIAVSGYLGGQIADGYPVGAAILGQAGTVTVEIFVPPVDVIAGRHSGYNVCARSGMKAKPGQLVIDPYTGQWVLPKYVDEPQPHPEQSRRDLTRGPSRPERYDEFITTPVDKDDL